MKSRLLVGAAMAAACVASAASAQVASGFYGALDLGYHRPEPMEVEPVGEGSNYDWTIDSEDDWAGFARIGYRLSPNFRVELEGGYRGADVGSVRGQTVSGVSTGLCTPGVVRTATNPACGDPAGSIESYTLMANAIYDFSFSPSQRIVPFIGAGVGANRTSIDMLGQFANVGAVSATNPAIQNLAVDDEDLSFAYQALAGVTYNATERLSIDLTYRYLRGGFVEFDSVGSSRLQPGAFAGRYEDQSVTLGLRYAFSVPTPPPEPIVEAAPPPPPVEAPPPVVETPPPPPPPPAPVFEAREFIVYFPFDQSILTPEAQTVVQEAATYAGSGAATRVAVVGHADTSGSAAYNIRLSERRSRAVADAIVALGVNPALITADWRGEAAPAVPTGDGVKEPLNRRATIAIN